MRLEISKIGNSLVIATGMKNATRKSMSKTTFLFLVVVVTSTLLVGCNGSADKGNQSAKGSREYNYAYDKKEVFVADASNDLAALDQKISELADKAAAASDDFKTNTQVEIQTLWNQRATLNQRLAALQNATAANWEDAKADFKNDYDHAETSCQQAWQWISKKLGS